MVVSLPSCERASQGSKSFGNWLSDGLLGLVVSRTYKSMVGWDVDKEKDGEGSASLVVQYSNVIPSRINKGTIIIYLRGNDQLQTRLLVGLLAPRDRFLAHSLDHLSLTVPPYVVSVFVWVHAHSDWDCCGTITWRKKHHDRAID